MKMNQEIKTPSAAPEGGETNAVDKVTDGTGASQPVFPSSAPEGGETNAVDKVTDGTGAEQPVFPSSAAE
jgi:hypothetical protein